MTKLLSNIWCTEPVETTDRPVLSVVVGARRTLMIDGGNSPRHAEQLLHEIESIGVPEADYIAITHSHWDHVFGLAALKGIILTNRITGQDIRRLSSLRWRDDELSERVRKGWVHPMSASMIREEIPGDRSDFRIREPDVVNDTELEVDLGATVCRLEQIGGDHARDSTVVHLPRERIAFIGDCLYLRHPEI
jgi:glyoxylase-like metal-dependent hydrolase (beta-lactamase superfamily II)